MPRPVLLARPLPLLPSEIKSTIVEFLGTLTHPLAFELPRYSQAALLALCLTSKSFNGWAEPILYRHISIHFSDIALLNNTFHYYEGSYRPPQRSNSARRVISLRIRGTRPKMADEGLDLGDLTELRYLLKHCAPTLERLSTHVLFYWSTLRILQRADLKKLSCCVIHPSVNVPLPGLQVQACHVAFYPFHAGIASTTAVDYQELLGSLSPCHIQQLLVVELCLPRDTQSLSSAIKAFLRQHPELHRVLMVPFLAPFIDGHRTWSSMLDFVNALTAELGNEPELMSKVQVVKVPKEVRHLNMWTYGKLLDGTVWSLDGLAYTDREVVKQKGVSALAL